MRYIGVMEPGTRRLNHVFAAFVAAALLAGGAGATTQPQAAPSAEVAALLEELAAPDQDRWERLERQIMRLWSQSGSASADLLLQRGRDALRVGNTAAAIEHLSALVDHAPDFAEAYHTRATAFFMANLFGPAMADLEETLYRNPLHFSALSGLGVILEELGYLERALDAYRAAQAIHPHRPDLLRALERVERRLAGLLL